MKPYHDLGDVQIYLGDCREVLPQLPEESVHCVVTSPPYWGLRDYGIPPGIWPTKASQGVVRCANGDHLWQAERFYTEQTAAKDSADAFSEPGEANAQRLKDGRWREHEWCSLCGAWRGCFGLEPTPELYVQHAVEIFREVKRVLRADGVCWINLGDCYNQGPKGQSGELHPSYKQASNKGSLDVRRGEKLGPNHTRHQEGLKPKDLIGMPWRIVLALQADGWYFRQWCPWIKRNSMPESAEDRPSVACETLFLLSKSSRYFYDADAVKVPATGTAHARGNGVNPKAKMPGVNSRIHQDRDPHHPAARKPRQNESFSAAVKSLVDYRVRRNHDWFLESWEGMLTDDDGWALAFVVNTAPYPEAHYATFPPDLIKPCILAGCPKGGTVLDPFLGSGTTAMVARAVHCKAIGIELNEKDMKLCAKRLRQEVLQFA